MLTHIYASSFISYPSNFASNDRVSYCLGREDITSPRKQISDFGKGNERVLLFLFYYLNGENEAVA